MKSIRSKFRLGTAKESAWEFIVWFIIRTIFVIMVIVEIILTILVYTQRKVVTHTSIDHQHTNGANFPNLLLCPMQPVNMSYVPADVTAPVQLRDFVLGHVTPSYLPLRKPLSEWKSEELTAISAILEEKSEANFTYTSQLDKFYKNYGYNCTSTVQSCRMAHAFESRVDCCGNSAVVPTIYGPCLFMELENLRVKQHTPGLAGGLIIQLSVDNNGAADNSVLGPSAEVQSLARFNAFLLDRWSFYPQAGTAVLRHNYQHYLNVKAHRRYLLGRRRDRIDDDDWDDELEEEYKRSQGQSNVNRVRTFITDLVIKPYDDPLPVERRRDCVFQCQLMVVVSECGCLPFYGSLGTNIKSTSLINPPSDVIPVCNVTKTIDCVISAARNASAQLASNIDEATDQQQEIYEELGINNTKRLSTTEQIRRDLKAWWKLNYKEPKDCISQCSRGDVVTTFDLASSQFPLYPDVDPKDTINAEIHIGYSDMVMGVSRESFSMTVSEMLWIMGTNVAIWVVLYHILRSAYNFIKQMCHSCSKKSNRTTVIEPENNAPPQTQSRPPTNNSRPGTGNLTRPPLDMQAGIEARPTERPQSRSLKSPNYDRSLPPANASQLPPIQQPIK